MKNGKPILILFLIGCARMQTPEMPEQEAVCMMDTCFREERPYFRQNLPLKGAAVAEKALFQGYGLALYAPNWVRDEQQILSTNVPKSLVIEFEQNLELKQMLQGITMGKLEDPEVREGFVQMAKTIFPIEAEDRNEFVYEPGKGTLVLRNGEYKTTIASPRFAKAFFQIWLERHNKGNQLLRPGFKP